MAEFYKWYVSAEDDSSDRGNKKSVFFIANLPHPLWHDFFGVDIWIDEKDKVNEIFFTYNFENPEEFKEEPEEASPELIASIWKQAHKQLSGVFDTIFNYSPSR